MSAGALKWIGINQWIVTAPAIDRTAAALDKYFENYPVTMTSGKRTAQVQLRIIQDKVKHHGIDKLYPEFNLCFGSGAEFKTKIDGGEEYYFWQRAWSKLLNIGDIVNPPVPAEVLFDYYRPGSTVNGKGRVIGASPHAEGLAFDLAGHDIKEIGNRVHLAKENGDAFVHGYLVEPVNSAVHVDCVA